MYNHDIFLGQYTYMNIFSFVNLYNVRIIYSIFVTHTQIHSHLGIKASQEEFTLLVAIGFNARFSYF